MLCTPSRETATRWRDWRNCRLQLGRKSRDLMDAAALRVAFMPASFRVTYALSNLRSLSGRLSGREAAGGTLMPNDWARIPSAGIFEAGKRNLDKLSQFRALREEQVKRYFELLRSQCGTQITLPPVVPWISHFPLRCSNRDQVAQSMIQQGIHVSRLLFDQLLSDFPWLCGSEMPPLPRARALTQTVLQLPIFPKITATQQTEVVKALKKALDKSIVTPH